MILYNKKKKVNIKNVYSLYFLFEYVYVCGWVVGLCV